MNAQGAPGPILPAGSEIIWSSVLTLAIIALVLAVTVVLMVRVRDARRAAQELPVRSPGTGPKNRR